MTSPQAEPSRPYWSTVPRWLKVTAIGVIGLTLAAFVFFGDWWTVVAAFELTAAVGAISVIIGAEAERNYWARRNAVANEHYAAAEALVARLNAENESLAERAANAERDLMATVEEKNQLRAQLDQQQPAGHVE
ncbi:hypothetical protein ACQP1V_43155 (plasmid) [Microtetraspora malaysiensis]|uniref:hypothetical protein n=1 Tax=Microtetraspora malaysiensis TaxID=161358 RepID=UPI003D89EA0A